MSDQHKVVDDDSVFTIDPISRSIFGGPDDPILVQYDHNSERYTFQIQRIIEGHDMSACNLVEVHYDNYNTGGTKKNSDIYIVDDLQISGDDDDTVTFSWLIKDTATQIVGLLDFSICFQCIADDGSKEYAWHTGTYQSVNVIKTTHNTETIAENNTDLVSTVIGYMNTVSGLVEQVETELNSIPTKLSDLQNDLVFDGIIVKDSSTESIYILRVTNEKLTLTGSPT